MGGGLGRVTKHHEYYLTDGSVSFLTGKILFRVHKTFLERESEIFRELFANAAEDDPQSGTDARPFTLDVQPEEFEQLLWVWYDRDYSYRQQTKDNWVTILRLSTRWEFPKIRELAVRQLEALELPPAERISIYNEHGIDGEQLLSSYVDICKSPTVPTEADGRLIPMEILINLLQAREDAQRKAVELGHESPTSASLEDEALREIVSKLLNKGLNPRSHGTSTGSGGQAPDGERACATTASTSTITLAEPQVPDRTAQSVNRPQSHPNNPHQTGNSGKGSREREQEKEVENMNAREKAKQASDEAKALKASQDKEKEEKEKQENARQAREKEEREKQAKQAKEKEEREKMEKAKKDKEKEAREKAEKAEQKPLRNAWGNSRGI